jgi:hypothetical protein
MDGLLEPNIVEILEKGGDLSISVQKIADMIGGDAKSCHVARICGRLMREGRVVLTRTRDESGRGPFFKLADKGSVSPKSESASEEDVSPKPPKSAKKARKVPDKLPCSVCGRLVDPRVHGRHVKACKAKEKAWPPGAIPITDHETGTCTMVAPNHTQVSYTVPPLNVVVPSSPGPLLRPMVFLQEVEGFAERAGFTVKYVEFMPDEIIVKLLNEKAAKKLQQQSS